MVEDRFKQTDRHNTLDDDLNLPWEALDKADEEKISVNFLKKLI